MLLIGWRKRGALMYIYKKTYSQFYDITACLWKFSNDEKLIATHMC